MIAIRDRRLIWNGASGFVVDYVIDHESEIAALPIAPKISSGSTVIIMDTGEVRILMGDDWRPL